MARVEQIRQGDTPTFRLRAKASGVAIDITGYASASLKIAKSLNIPNTDALYYESVLAASFSNGPNGINDFVITEDTTKVFDIDSFKYQFR